LKSRFEEKGIFYHEDKILKIDMTGNKNPNWKGGEDIICLNCEKSFHVVPARQKTAKFCSRVCKGKWMSRNLRGEKHPNWQIERPKTKYCRKCGSEFFQRKTEAISFFRKRKFCSKGCADVGGLRYEGEAHPNYKAASRRKAARGKHGAWAHAVISRDKAICKECGAKDVELHAHHIKQFSEHPEKRWQISNGITLCYRCHWQIHELKIQNDDALGQNHVIPSESYKKGKQSRRWEGFCEWCGTFISKQWSQRKNRAHHFCSKSCAQKHRIRHLSDETRQKMSVAQKDAALRFRSERIKAHSQSGTFLQNLRIEKDISQRELAGLIGISQGRLSELENGKYKISEKITVRLASVLEVEISVFELIAPTH